LHGESLLLKRQRGDGFGAASSLCGLAQLEWLRKDYKQALSLLRESLSVLQELDMWGLAALDMQLMAHVTADCGEAERSACLFGAVEAIRERVGDKRSGPAVLNMDPARTEASLAACRAGLTRAAFKSAWAAGQAMSTGEAIAFALRD
jgi:hypothetical protein